LPNVVQYPAAQNAGQRHCDVEEGLSVHQSIKAFVG
jgi:hypothetical protein